MDKRKKDKLTIKKAGESLNVPRAGYYKHLPKQPTKREIEKERLSENIKEIFEEHKGCCGTLRLTGVLNDQGIKINRKRVGKLLPKMGFYAKGSQYKYKHYKRKEPTLDLPNLLNQVFQTDVENKVEVGDIIYIPTQRGTLYLAVFLDMFTRKVTGWAMDTQIK